MLESIERLKKYVAANTDESYVLTSYPPQYRVVCSTMINDLIDAVEREVEEQIEERYVELPKDADGETIRIGDVMECNGKKLKVMALSETQAFFFDDGEIANYGVKIIRHYKPPTVEDVLEEALNRAANLDRKEGYWPSAADITNIVNEIAPKLQLREAE